MHEVEWRSESARTRAQVLADQGWSFCFFSSVCWGGGQHKQQKRGLGRVFAFDAKTRTDENTPILYYTLDNLKNTDANMQSLYFDFIERPFTRARPAIAHRRNVRPINCAHTHTHREIRWRPRVTVPFLLLHPK